MRFQRLEALIGADNLQLLHQKTVLIAGIGGVGSYAAEAIARSGIGTIILVDHDVVDATNINRQLIALDETVGRKKVEVMAERIKQINPMAVIVPLCLFIDATTIESLFSLKPDFIIDAIDSVPSKTLLIETAVAKKIAIIASMGFARKMHPEKIELTTLAKTETCPLAREIRYRLRRDGVKLDIPVVYSIETPIESKLDSVRLGSNAFVPSTAGLIMASYVINQIIDKEAS